MLVNALITCLPLIALFVNIMLQISVVQFSGRIGLSIVSGLIGGFLTILIFLGFLFDINAITSSQVGSGLLSYLVLAFCFWAFLNLNITSLRIRIVRDLLKNDAVGLSTNLLLQHYSPQELIKRRILRLEKTGEIINQKGRWILNSKKLLFLGICLEFLRKLIIPKNKKAHKLSYHRSDSLRKIRSAWIQNKTLKINSFLSQDNAIKLQNVVNKSYELINIECDSPTINPDLLDNFKRWDGIWVHALPEFLTAKQPDLLADLSHVLNEITLGFRNLLKVEWSIDTRFSFFRRHYTYDPNKYVQWHTDAEAAKTLEVSFNCVNVWLPLNSVGTHLPSLELIPASTHKMRFEPPPEKIDNYSYRTEEWVKNNFPVTPWIPKAELGDALLFDHFTLHRTQKIAPQGIRTSCEFRFIPVAKE